MDVVTVWVARWTCNTCGAHAEEQVDDPAAYVVPDHDCSTRPEQ